MSTPIPQVTWDHVHIRTHDPEASATWFAEMLGAEIVRDGSSMHVKFGANRIFLAKVVEGDGVNPPPVAPYRGLEHIAFTVSDVDLLAAQLKEKGVRFSKEPSTPRPGVRVCFVLTPEGVTLELLQRNIA